MPELQTVTKCTHAVREPGNGLARTLPPG